MVFHVFSGTEKFDLKGPDPKDGCSVCHFLIFYCYYLTMGCNFFSCVVFLVICLYTKCCDDSILLDHTEACSVYCLPMSL